MGRTARASGTHRRATRPAALAKKALSIRPRTVTGAGAQPRPGTLGNGRSGARRAGANGAIQWLPTLLRGRPRKASDLVRAPRSQRPDQLWLVVVDASASTRRHGALAQAKGLLANLFEAAYRERARLAVLHATGHQPRWLWQGQKASPALHHWLAELGAGGGTPVIEALQQSAHWLARRQRQKPAEEQRLLVLTDGRLKDWSSLQPPGCPTLLVDIESGPIRLGRAKKLAEELGAEYRVISEL
ncbi:VWA domain-containing protein [Pseudomonas sp. BN411]|uniref:vWA domain-containing protein n=1 Tax=Pseudomonas sp. BN411 TaxID=2567887 RepID=UPI0024561AA3|nr:VWA domain-containing protein [Pseudomonas sp. BN411]MDH4560285.1 VWA domain-containing protein [Pseudomonas sp. BN411]